jgi:holliday junction DNA helicase RuvA
MIGHLRGTLLERAGHSVLVECGGVGYEVHLSGQSLAELGPEGSAVALRIYTHFIKSDFSITLYGFVSARERELFDLLITVKNVGPASAMKILSAGPGPQDIARLIAGGQVIALKGLRGVGKKTAELLVVELRERCEQLLMSWGQTVGGGPSDAIPVERSGPHLVRPPLIEDVASALGQLGWRPPEVDKAVSSLAPGPDATFEGLMRQALRTMPR